MALVFLAVVGAGAYYAWMQQFWTKPMEPAALTAKASLAPLRVTVTERGNLESRVTIDGICEVKGYENKIIFIVPEGTLVKPGDEVVRFDTEKIDKNIAEQEIHINEATSKVETAEQEIEVERNQGESDVATATLELELAGLDLRKYREGDYKVEWNNTNGAIALARFELEKAKEDLEHVRALVKKGFREPELLRQKEEDLRRTEFYLKRDEEKLTVLENFEYVRKMAELKAKAEEAGKKLVRAKATAKAKLTKLENALSSAKAALELRKKELDELAQLKEKCVIKATQAGVLAYANERWWDDERGIREGAMVHFRQKIFSLPDMSSMQAKVNVHESQIKKVKTGQKAQIRVDAFPNVLLEGTVTQVSPLADSTNSWMRGGVKEYTTVVTIDRMPSDELKPGMTAEVEILVNEVPDALVVPVQSVTERERQHYVYKRNGTGFERQTVKIGESNERFVAITDGLAPGDEVALDARIRALAEFDDSNVTTPPPVVPPIEKPSEKSTSPERVAAK